MLDLKTCKRILNSNTETYTDEEVEKISKILWQPAAATSSGLANFSGAARCDVKIVGLNYETVGVNGEPTKMLRMPTVSATTLRNSPVVRSW